MARPVSIKNDAVLDAARRIFLQHGYKATTAQVAREAGVSEGSLFKHFKTKTNLFVAAMESDSHEQALQERLMRSVGVGNMRKELECAGIQLLQRMQVVLPRIMMVRSSGITFQGDCHRDGTVPPPPLQHLRLLAKYFRAEMKMKRLAMRAPESQAHAFVGALIHYVFCEILYEFRPASPAAYVRTIVDTILRAATTADVCAPDAAGTRTRQQQQRRVKA